MKLPTAEQSALHLERLAQTLADWKGAAKACTVATSHWCPGHGGQKKTPPLGRAKNRALRHVLAVAAASSQRPTGPQTAAARDETQRQSPRETPRDPQKKKNEQGRGASTANARGRRPGKRPRGPRKTQRPQASSGAALLLPEKMLADQALFSEGLDLRVRRVAAV